MLQHFGIDEKALTEAMAKMPRMNSELTNEEIIEAALSVVKGELRLRDVKGLTDEEMEAAYAQGYNYFRAGAYAQAENTFEFLCTMDNFEPKYFKALGAARFNQKNYGGAVNAYSQAAIIDVSDPGLVIKIAQCHLGLGAIDTAKGALEAAIELAGDKPEYAEKKQKAQALFDLLESRG